MDMYRRNKPKSSTGWQNRTAPVLFALLLLASGYMVSCAPALSRQFRQRVGTPVAFQRLRAQPQEYEGQEVILGGYILETLNESEGTLLTVLQAPLNFLNKPKAKDLSEGRFLVHTGEFLDPEVYCKDRKLTVGGRFRGIHELPLGNATYRYPLIEAEELHLWPGEVHSPWPSYPYEDYWYHRHWYGYPYFLRRPW
ncbi:MAG: Slp family lipoprotein [Syntrophobacteria bacterium]